MENLKRQTEMQRLIEEEILNEILRENGYDKKENIRIENATGAFGERGRR